MILYYIIIHQAKMTKRYERWQTLKQINKYILFCFEILLRFWVEKKGSFNFLDILFLIERIWSFYEILSKIQ